MYFEYDPAKSAANKAKHGIGFDEAQKLWDDTYALMVESGTMEESRWLVVAEHGSKLWTAVITYRGAAIRIISVRRSREDEVRNYEKRKKEARPNKH